MRIGRVECRRVWSRPRCLAAVAAAVAAAVEVVVEEEVEEERLRS